MSRAVVISGAGLSVPFGFPILSNLKSDLEVVRYIEGNGNLKDFLEERGFFEGVTNIEEFYDNHLRIISKPGSESRSTPEYDRLRRDYLGIVFHAVFKGKSTKGWKGLNRLIEELESRFDSTVFATFNWDCCFESCYAQIGRINKWSPYRNPHLFCSSASGEEVMIDYREPKGSITLYKLHGGVNWWNVDGNAKYFQYSPGKIEKQWLDFLAGTIDDTPIILHPTSDKYINQPEFLRKQFDSFKGLLMSLRQEDCFIVLGYSAPKTDHSVMDLLKIATSSPCRRFVQYFSDSDRAHLTQLFGSDTQYSKIDFNKIDFQSNGFLNHLGIF